MYKTKSKLFRIIVGKNSNHKSVISIIRLVIYAGSFMTAILGKKTNDKVSKKQDNQILPKKMTAW